MSIGREIAGKLGLGTRIIFLKLLVAGHLTIYLTRNAGPIWQRPWPSWKLVAATETTQLMGTLAAIYGWFVTPIGWRLCSEQWIRAMWPDHHLGPSLMRPSVPVLIRPFLPTAF